MKNFNLYFFCVLALNFQIISGQVDKIADLVKQGIDHHDRGEFDQAIEIYQNALAIDENSSLANYEIAYTYLSNNQYELAEKYSKRVLDLKNGNLLEGYIAYGNSLDLQGKNKKAIQAYEEGLKTFDNYLLHYNLAMAHYNSENYDKASESAINAILNNSSHASSHLILSKIMVNKNVRIKAMLPLYFFLMIEPNSERAGIEYKNLRNYLAYGVTQKDNNNVDITVPMNGDVDFGAAEMMISLLKASENLEKNEGKSDMELFADNNHKLFKILGELKNENTGFWWDFYVTFFYDMAKENLTTPYSYYISLSKGQEVLDWLDKNSNDFERFSGWLTE
jgi:tetratricopeptide (TPR) repeat protein